MNSLMTKEESYAERRKLFKNIWETSMNVDEKEDILTKPKVIKTLRLDELDRIGGKKKKQKIKNLRNVCNKLLDFCDRQDADDLFYAQMATQNKEQPKIEIETSGKKKKVIKVKRKIKKAKSMFSHNNEMSLARATTSERKDDLIKFKTASRYTSPLKFKRLSEGVDSKTTKNRRTPRVTINNNISGDRNVRKKTVHKKRSKKIIPSIQLIPTVIPFQVLITVTHISPNLSNIQPQSNLFK
ncbi:uncharacterized protein LOC116766361 isoform X2 [Danaus plexippus]|uniref:uncharacterized protein LOC116766361 isoform X2 n=1 Tax=Danaus plexippus TaxID=13037 RepID=UPI002AB1DCF3|nr:uncharacterized protein LOC116766361 isoform X2 [Danaus plexippus]